MAFSACETFETLFIEQPQPEVVIIHLNRPAVGNALNATLVSELVVVLQQLQQDQAVQVVCLQGQGRHFCAGADLQWMQQTIECDKNENLAEANKIDALMFSLYQLNKPTIAVVSGAAYGGGMGLVSCCDMAIASEQSQFCLPEVKLGLVSAVIMPYVISAIGQRAARRYMLTAEVISAPLAQQLGLLHEVVAASELQNLTQQLIEQLLSNSPEAIAVDKAALQQFNPVIITPERRQQLVQQIAEIRVTEPAQARMKAFLQKRRKG